MINLIRIGLRPELIVSRIIVRLIHRKLSLPLISSLFSTSIHLIKSFGFISTLRLINNLMRCIIFHSDDFLLFFRTFIEKGYFNPLQVNLLLDWCTEHSKEIIKESSNIYTFIRLKWIFSLFLFLFSYKKFIKFMFKTSFFSIFTSLSICWNSILYSIEFLRVFADFNLGIWNTIIKKFSNVRTDFNLKRLVKNLSTVIKKISNVKEINKVKNMNPNDILGFSFLYFTGLIVLGAFATFSIIVVSDLIFHEKLVETVPIIPSTLESIFSYFDKPYKVFIGLLTTSYYKTLYHVPFKKIFSYFYPSFLKKNVDKGKGKDKDVFDGKDINLDGEEFNMDEEEDITLNPNDIPLPDDSSDSSDSSDSDKTLKDYLPNPWKGWKDPNK